MGDLAEFPLSMRVFLQAYPWRRVRPTPWSPLRRPLNESRVALVTSAGFIRPGQEPFDAGIRGGDTSFRIIPGDAVVGELIDSQRSESFDHAGMQQDPNLALPLDRLRELEAHGRIGAVAPRHLSYMGSITAPGRLVRQTAVEGAAILTQDQVDAALLVPV